MISSVEIQRRHVWAVWFCFFCCGFLYSQFTSRMPALEAHVGTDEAGVGVLLMCFAAGSISGLLSSGLILRYIEARTMLRYAISGFCLGLLLIALISSFTLLMAGFAFWGFCCAYLDIGMNSQAMYLEAYARKNYMATMHANYSVGCVLGSGVSAIFAWADLSLAANYCSLAIVLGVSFILVFQHSLLPDPKVETKESEDMQNGSEQNVQTDSKQQEPDLVQKVHSQDKIQEAAHNTASDLSPSQNTASDLSPSQIQDSTSVQDASQIENTTETVDVATSKHIAADSQTSIHSASSNNNTANSQASLQDSASKSHFRGHGFSWASIPFFILLCGVMSFLSYTAEGSVAEWGSLVMHTTKNASESLSALAYGVLACTMALARFGVDPIRTRVPDIVLIICGAGIAAVAISIVIWTDNPIICLICYGFLGIGLAPISPVAYSRAGSSHVVSAKVASLIISLIGYSGFLIVPPVLGYVGAHYGLERALFIPLTAVILIIFLSTPFRQKHRQNKAQYMKGE